MDWLERYDAAVAGGVARGEVRCEEIKLIKMICRKLRKAKSLEQIADELEEDYYRIKAICDTVINFEPDYDEEKVINAVLEPVTGNVKGFKYKLL